MSNLVLGYQNNLLLGGLVVSSSVPGLDASQLQNDQGNAATAWQTTGAGTATLTITAAVGSKWRAFALFRTNLTTAAVVTVQVRNGSGGGVLVTADSAVKADSGIPADGFDGSGGGIVYNGTLSALTAGYGQLVLVAPTEVTGDWCRFTITDPSNPDGFFNIPLAFAGTVFQPIRNMSYASSSSRSSSSVKAQLRAGGVIIRNDWTKRAYDCTFAGLKASELPTVRAIELAGEQGNNVLFVPDPSSATITQEAIYGEFEPQAGLTYPYQAGDARGYRVIVTERL